MMTQQREEAINGDVAIKDSGSTTDVEENYNNKQEESVVWPAMVVFASILFEHKEESILADIAKKLKVWMILNGCKPSKMYALRSGLGQSGCVVAEFGKDWDKFNNAMKLAKAFEVKKRARKDWYEYDEKRCKNYAWIAKDEDYHSNYGVGDFLRKNGVLKSLSEIKKDNNPEDLLGLETLGEEMSKISKQSHMDSLMKQKDMAIDKLNQDLKKMKDKANKMIEDTQIKLQKADHEKKMNEITILEQKKEYDRLLKLACDDKRDKEILGNQNIELQKKVESIQEDVKEKEKEIRELKEVIQSLIAKEKFTNDELENARKELISGLREMYDPASSSANSIAVKRKNNDDDDDLDYSLVREIWNTKENRRATLEEGVQLIFKIHKP